jgi:hypothetical protein
MNEKILSMTFGQHILYGMTCSTLQEAVDYNPSVQDSIKMIDLIIRLDSPENHNTELTPSEAIQEYPDKVVEIFSDFYDTYQNIIWGLIP